MDNLFKFLLKLVPSSFLAKLQNLPKWAYILIVAINGGIAALYNYYIGAGLTSDAAVAQYILLAISSLFGAKALPSQPAGEFDVPNGK